MLMWLLLVRLRVWYQRRISGLRHVHMILEYSCPAEFNLDESNIKEAMLHNGNDRSMSQNMPVVANTTTSEEVARHVVSLPRRFVCASSYARHTPHIVCHGKSTWLSNKKYGNVIWEWSVRMTWSRPQLSCYVDGSLMADTRHRSLYTLLGVAIESIFVFMANLALKKCDIAMDKWLRLKVHAVWVLLRSFATRVLFFSQNSSDAGGFLD